MDGPKRHLAVRRMIAGMAEEEDLLPAGLVRPVRIDRSGVIGPTPAQARGPRWRRTSHGFYVPAQVDAALPEQRIVEASVVAPERSGITGWAALRWLGATWFSGLGYDGRLRPVVIAAVTATARSQPGIRVSEERLSLRDLTIAHGVPITVPAHAACLEARYAANLVDAVIVWDTAAFADLVSRDEAAEVCRQHASWTGVPQARAAQSLSVENSWSPMETVLRLAWIGDPEHPRRPPPLCNTPIFDRSGRHLGTPDLFDPDYGVVGEYNGSVHLEGARRARDIVRDGLFRDHGLECFEVVAGDLGVPGRVEARIAAAYRRARPVPRDQRTWTLTPPPWWRPTTTVAQRRRLALEGRGHLLPSRHRAA